MKLKEKLIVLKNKLQKENLHFQNHELGNQNMYRLHYLEFYDETKFGCTDFVFRPFYLPENMGRVDAFKVLSYLKGEIEKYPNMRKVSVHYLDMYLDTQELGFKRVEGPINENGVIDLFFIAGKKELFEKSEYYNKYYDWYIPNIKKEEVVAIYESINKTFKNPVLVKIK